MPSLTGLLIGGVLPGVIALGLLAFLHVSFHQRVALLARILPPVIVAIAFVPAPIVVNGKHDLWPLNASERALAVALAAGILGLLGAGVGRPRVVLIVPGIVCSAFASLSVLLPLHPHAVSTGLVVGASLVGAAWGGGATYLLARTEMAVPGARVPLMLALVVFASSLVILFSAIGTSAQQVGALVAVLSSVAMVAFWTRRPTLGAAGFGAIVSILAYFLVGTWQLARNPATGSLAIIATMVLSLPIAARFASGGRSRSVIAWSALLFAAAIAVGWAFTIYHDAAKATPTW